MVFKGSRYDGGITYFDEEHDISYLSPSSLNIKAEEEDLVYQYQAGDRMDLLAVRFYGDAQDKWIILLANPQYDTELDIKIGDILNIPNPERMKSL